MKSARFRAIRNAFQMTTDKRLHKVLPPTSLSTVRGTPSLQEFLVELASILLPGGMTPKTFGQMANVAFVRAAAENSRLQNGKVNQSRVAAQTGLTRSNIRRLLSTNVSDCISFDDTPIQRLIDGWRTDPTFATDVDQPKRLSVEGRSASLIVLVRKYCGDLPHRAVLDELRRIGAVSCDGLFVQLRRSFYRRRRRDFSFLSPVVPALIDRLRLAASKPRWRD